MEHVATPSQAWFAIAAEQAKNAVKRKATVAFHFPNYLLRTCQEVEIKCTYRLWKDVSAYGGREASPAGASCASGQKRVPRGDERGVCVAPTQLPVEHWSEAPASRHFQHRCSDEDRRIVELDSFCRSPREKRHKCQTLKRDCNQFFPYPWCIGTDCWKSRVFLSASVPFKLCLRSSFLNPKNGREFPPIDFVEMWTLRQDCFCTDMQGERSF